MFRNSKVGLLALLTVFCLVFSVTYVSAQTLNISGTYKVTGTNPNGSKYRGSVDITLNDDGTYAFEWSVGNSFSGTGTLSGNILTVDWGDTYPVIYTVTNNGAKLDGTWGNGAGKETLTK